VGQAQRFLGGQALAFASVDALWRELKDSGEFGLARAVLARLRDPRSDALLDVVPASRSLKSELCREQALLTSRDPDAEVATRHDEALLILAEEFDVDSETDPEVLGIAGGIFKRRWEDLGQLADLQRAALLYERGSRAGLGTDGYTSINAAFTDDLLAAAGDEPQEHRERATQIRTQLVEDLSPSGTWWNAATRAEALFGLRRYEEARAALEAAPHREPWQLETTARQLATLARLQSERPLEQPEIRAVFETLLPGEGDGVRSAFLGRVGLALSGGGFRASFYHLGLLARLAELDVLRHVDVLSCVSGGSIVGACYWLALRRRLLDSQPLTRNDYVEIVREVIAHFIAAVESDLRGQVFTSRRGIAWRLFKGDLGAMDSEAVARALESAFYRPLLPGEGPLFMDELPFTPADHRPMHGDSTAFRPGRHNWLRAHKVPVLVLNATTVNTGHAWQFTPTWMGESPWAIHEAADSIPRLEWSYYEPQAGWRVPLGLAVAASACVPMVFSPVRIGGAYEDIDVQLLDGGVHDNQGCISLLALGCNVVIASDASGQMLLERRPGEGLFGTPSFAKRSFDAVSARLRMANFADLAARRRSGLLRGLSFIHMKEGLDADPIRPRFSQSGYELRRRPLSRTGVRMDFQRRLAELRTDLDVFTPDESQALMACGYQMTASAFTRDLAQISELWAEPVECEWGFSEMLEEITSTAAATPRRQQLLDELSAGSSVRL